MSDSPKRPWSDACDEHWRRVRENLPPFVWRPHPPIVRFPVTNNEAADIATFARLRRDAIEEFERRQAEFEEATRGK